MCVCTVFASYCEIVTPSGEGWTYFSVCVRTSVCVMNEDLALFGSRLSSFREKGLLASRSHDFIVLM